GTGAAPLQRHQAEVVCVAPEQLEAVLRHAAGDERSPQRPHPQPLLLLVLAKILRDGDAVEQLVTRRDGSRKGMPAVSAVWLALVADVAALVQLGAVVHLAEGGDASNGVLAV